MKHRSLILALSLALVLSGCAQPAETATETTTTTATTDTSTEAVLSSDLQEKSELIIDPPYDFDPAEMVPSDFGNYFQEEFPMEISTYTIAEGTQWVNEVTVLQAAEEGPTFYIIAGVHGNEQAAWLAGNLLKKATFPVGTLYILSPANRWGASEDPPSRYVSGTDDLNRSFPGDINGTDGEQVAYYIYQDVVRVSPDFVFDLHEAQKISTSSDFLGSSIIFTSLNTETMSSLVMDILLDSEAGLVFSEPLQFYSPGPTGSVNSTICNQLNLPVLTVETFRGFEMDSRIGDQLDVVHYTMAYYGMIDR